MDEAYEHTQLQELVWHQITPIADDLVDSLPLRIHSQLKTSMAEIASAQTSPFLGGGKGQIWDVHFNRRIGREKVKFSFLVTELLQL